MATTSEVKAGLDDVAQEIRTERRAALQAKARLSAAQANLGNIPTKYADLINTIDGYAGTDEFEALSKDEKDRLAAEFNALKAKVDGAVADLSAYDFSV